VERLKFLSRIFYLCCSLVQDFSLDGYIETSSTVKCFTEFIQGGLQGDQKQNKSRVLPFVLSKRL
jgi:hypothetical protein